MKREIRFSIYKLNISFDVTFFLVILVILVLGKVEMFALVSASIFLHEIAHVCAGIIFGWEVLALRILPVGFNAVLNERGCTKSGRVIVYAIGPIINLLLALFAIVIEVYGFPESQYAKLFKLINLSLCIFNLLPIIPLDGGRILREILKDSFGTFRARKILRWISIIFSIIFVILGILQIKISIYNFSLLLIGAYVFFLTGYEETEAALMNIKSILYRRSRFVKKGIYMARDIVVTENTLLNDTIKYMDFDKFHIFYVIDENMKIIKLFTEQEIIEGLIKNNPDVTFAKLLDEAH